MFIIIMELFFKIIGFYPVIYKNLIFFAFVNMNLVKVLEKLFFSTIKVSSNFSFKYFINNIWQQKDDILVLFLSSQSNYVKFQLTVHVFEKMAC